MENKFNIGDTVEILSFDEIRANGDETTSYGDVYFYNGINFVNMMQDYCGRVSVVTGVGFENGTEYCTIKDCGGWMWTADIVKIIDTEPIQDVCTTSWMDFIGGD